MRLHQLIIKLRARGYKATRGRIRYAISRGYIEDPERDSRGHFFYTRAHMEQLKCYFCWVRPGPRSQLQQYFVEVKGPNDRICRSKRRAEFTRRQKAWDDAISSIKSMPGKDL